MRWSAAILALAVGVVISACGYGTNMRARISPATPFGAVRSAYAATLAAQTARLETTVTYYDVRPPQHVTGRGVIDLSRQRFRLELHGPKDTTAQLRQIGSLRYRHQVYGNTSLQPWTKTNVALVLRNQPTHVLNHQATNPAVLIGYLRAVSNPVRTIGTQTLETGPATHYRAAIDLVELSQRPGIWEEVAPLVRDRMKAERIPVDVWVGSEGRIARLRITLPIDQVYTVGRHQGRPRYEVTIRLFDYGTPVQITHPPRAQVHDITQRIATRVS